MFWTKPIHGRKIALVGSNHWPLYTVALLFVKPRTAHFTRVYGIGMNTWKKIAVSVTEGAWFRTASVDRSS